MPTLPETHLNLFADDTMIHTTSISTKHAAKKHQYQLDTIAPWFKEWKLSLNAAKTVTIFFGNKITKPDPIQINGIVTQWSPHTKYLGVHLDSHLRFNIHISNTTQTVKIIKGTLFPILNRWSPIPYKTKINIYEMYIRPVITYASPAWGAQISPTNWKQLEAIQLDSILIKIQLEDP